MQRSLAVQPRRRMSAGGPHTSRHAGHVCHAAESSRHHVKDRSKRALMEGDARASFDTGLDTVRDHWTGSALIYPLGRAAAGWTSLQAFPRSR